MASYTTRTLQNGVRTASKYLRQQSLRVEKRGLRTANVLRKPILPLISSSHHGHNHLQMLTEALNNKASELSEVGKKGRAFQVTFEDDCQGELPFLWLRDNCQCSSCFNKVALGRNFLMQNLDLNAHPISTHYDGNTLNVTWNDNHKSSFSSDWLYQRAFRSNQKMTYKNFHRFQREPWGKELSLDKFLYDDLFTNDSELLKWLLTMEVKGVALIRNTPLNPDAGPQLIDRIGFVKQSHYGRRSPVIVRENSNNVAFTNIKLGLHNDLPQYFHQAGIIFIHTLSQHRGEGGEGTVSDGLLATNLIRENHPSAFQLLTKNDVYFWDKGVANLSMETDEFYKINKGPIIGLDTEENLETMRVNNQVRNSHLELPPERVNSFYEAMKLLDDTLYTNAFNFKMEDGDILTLDNLRCLHGREGFKPPSARHLESSYLDWDEALCRRRRLLEKMNYI